MASTHRASTLPAARALCALLLALAACRAAEPVPRDGDASGDPGQGEVEVAGARGGWQARLVLDRAPVGIWTVRAVPFLPRYGTPEVVALDDLGRCHVLIPYSGKWTPLSCIEDGRWLGALAAADVDPRVPGGELYVGGQAGNLYQVIGHAEGSLEARRIAAFPGQELHTLVAGPLDPRVEGPVLFAFTHPGGLHRLRPTGPHGGFESELLEELPGRVRDAVVLDAGPGGARIATASRDGRVAILVTEPGGMRWETVHTAPMGAGRLALAAPRAGQGMLLYSTRDDGRVLRHELADGGSWRTETIYLGPQGPRGLAAGRFHADPKVESVAVFGYSREVVLLTREGAAWRAETVFVDQDKGHWLEVAELDGRNGTDELLCTGYGGRVVLLARPAGYGLEPGPALGP